jgi:hypothetical protein
MAIKFPFLLTALLFTGSFFARGQIQSLPKITYSDPERDDGRRTNFEIIGKLNGNFLVYKSNRGDGAISIYDNDMKLVKRVTLDYLPDQLINIDFVAYPDYFFMIYEYQKKNIVHCMAAKLNGDAQKLTEPIQLDTTQISWSGNNKIYNIAFSEDKQRIMVFKISNRNPKNFIFSTSLFNNNLELLGKNRMGLTMEERNDFFTDFLLTNEGTLVFGKFLRQNSGEFITKLEMVSKHPDSSQFLIRDMEIGNHILDEIKLKVDNHNHQVLVNAFYYKEKRGNIEGLYTVAWDTYLNRKSMEITNIFADDLRTSAKSVDGSQKLAFNDYFIKNVISRRDGGFLVISESEYTTSRSGPFNRWDNFGMGPWGMTPYGYNYWSPYNNFYSPYYGRYGYPYGGSNPTRYHAENVLALSFNKEGKIEWSSVIPKSQYDDETEASVSYLLMNTGSDLHFLFNIYERRNLMLNDQAIGPDGKVTRNPTLKNLDKGYEFMPRYGKQVSSWQLLVPCWYRNYLCFAKVEF